MVATVLGGLLMIIILVTIHELGHLLVARKCGVGVKSFSIGFGPGFVLFRTKDFPVYFRFILLGGYVSLKSEKDARDKEVRGKCLEGAGWLQKLAICFAGVGFNLILAVLIRTCLFLFAPPDLELKILSGTIGFLQVPAWYLAPFYGLKMTFLTFARMFVGVLMSIWYMALPIVQRTPVPHGGIIGLVSLGEIIKQGIWAYLALIYWLSIVLAVVNLLPLIPLDGGLIVLTIAERIFRNSRAFKVIRFLVSYAGMIFLALLFLNIVISDLFDIGIWPKPGGSP